MNEAQFKSIIKKSVKAQGGFALSLAAPMVSGLPDLYVSMPGFIPILLEAKWLQFGPNRKIPITPLQRKTLEHCYRVNRGAYILCGVKFRNGIYATICNFNETHLDKDWKGVDLFNNKFDVSFLMSLKNIPVYYT